MAKAKTPGRRAPAGGNPARAAMGKAQTVPAVATVAVDSSAPKKKKTSIPQFFAEVRAEGRKIVWPSRKETWITSVMVFLMVLVATVFFGVVDSALSFLSRIVLAIGQ
ncbi:preprotein translocase subunit SecE [soil metagenome]